MPRPITDRVLTLFCRSREEQQGPLNINHEHPLAAASATIRSSLGASSAPSTETDPIFALPGPSLHGSLPLLSPSNSDPVSFTPASFVTNSEDTRGLSLDTALNPDRTEVGADTNYNRFLEGTPESLSNTRQDDPIDLGIVRRPSAQYLFEGYGTCLSREKTIITKIFVT